MAQIPWSITTAVAELDKLFEDVQPPAASPSRKRTRSTRPSVEVSTPALMTLLPHSRKRQRLEWLTHAQLERARSEGQAYRPASLDDLLARIATFTLTLWDDKKPAGWSAADFALHGWRCSGKRREEVTCDVCSATWTIQPGGGSLQETAETIRIHGSKTKPLSKLKAKHASGCPWRGALCSGSLYRLHLEEPRRQLLSRVLERCSSFPRDTVINVKHPLTAEQVGQLRDALTSSRTQAMLRKTGEISEENLEEALVAACLGWTVLPQNASPAGSSSETNKMILYCKLCARRLLVKAQRTTTEQDGVPTVNPALAVDLAASHRRFCPYITALPGAETPAVGYEALLNRVIAPTNQSETAGTSLRFSDAQNLGQDQITNRNQTREALRYVKELLGSPRNIKRVM